MGNRICNQENGGYTETKQDHKASEGRGNIGDRSRNLAKLIGVDRVSLHNFRYEGTYYVTEDGETYDKEYVDTHKPRKTGVAFYEVSNWIYNERKQMYEPIVRRIVIIKNTDIQLSLNYE